MLVTSCRLVLLPNKSLFLPILLQNYHLEVNGIIKYQRILPFHISTDRTDTFYKWQKDTPGSTLNSSNVWIKHTRGFRNSKGPIWLRVSQVYNPFPNLKKNYKSRQLIAVQKSDGRIFEKVYTNCSNIQNPLQLFENKSWLICMKLMNYQPFQFHCHQWIGMPEYQEQPLMSNQIQIWNRQKGRRMIGAEKHPHCCRQSPPSESRWLAGKRLQMRWLKASPYLSETYC